MPELLRARVSNNLPITVSSMMHSSIYFLSWAEIAMDEITFEVEETEEGFIARAIGYAIFTQADSLEELRKMVIDAVKCHFDEKEMPKVIRLKIVRQEVLSL